MNTSAHTSERIYLGKPEGECWVAQYAVDGKLCVPFYVHEVTVKRFRTDEEFYAFLEHKALEMLELYGPADRSIA